MDPTPPLSPPIVKVTEDEIKDDVHERLMSDLDDALDDLKKLVNDKCDVSKKLARFPLKTLYSWEKYNRSGKADEKMTKKYEEVVDLCNSVFFDGEKKDSRYKTYTTTTELDNEMVEFDSELNVLQGQITSLEEKLYGQ